MSCFAYYVVCSTVCIVHCRISLYCVLCVVYCIAYFRLRIVHNALRVVVLIVPCVTCVIYGTLFSVLCVVNCAFRMVYHIVWLHIHGVMCIAYYVFRRVICTLYYASCVM